MMDFVPVLVDGAIVLNLQRACHGKAPFCERCFNLVACVHNWMRHYQVPYLILDFQDDKDICVSFLEETLQMRKRLSVPVLFVGVMPAVQRSLTAFNNYGDAVPTFTTPEDAARALRISNPGITEFPLRRSVVFGQSLQIALVQMGAEFGVALEMSA